MAIVRDEANTSFAGGPPEASAHDHADQLLALTQESVDFGAYWPNSTGEDPTTRLYFALLRSPNPTRQGLHNEGFSPDFVESSLTILSERGLIVDALGDAIEVVPPEVGIPRFAAALEQHARLSRAATQILAQLYHRSRYPRPAVTGRLDVHLFNSARDLEFARAEMLANARGSLTRVVAYGPKAQLELRAEVERLVAISTVDPSASDTPKRMVVDLRILDEDGSYSLLREIKDLGVDVRISTTLLCNAIVVDNAALLDLTVIDPSGVGSMIIRHPPLVSLVAGICNSAYDAGAQLPVSTSVAHEPQTLGTRDRQILGLVAAGATDSTIARQLRVSQRTVERRLRSIMDELGATTRFQAGVQAAKRGLV